MGKAVLVLQAEDVCLLDAAAPAVRCGTALWKSISLVFPLSSSSWWVSPCFLRCSAAWSWLLLLLLPPSVGLMLIAAHTFSKHPRPRGQEAASVLEQSAALRGLRRHSKNAGVRRNVTPRRNVTVWRNNASVSPVPELLSSTSLPQNQRVFDAGLFLAASLIIFRRYYKNKNAPR